MFGGQLKIFFWKNKKIIKRKSAYFVLGFEVLISVLVIFTCTGKSNICYI